MPNSIGPTGLVTKTQAELIAEYTANYQAVYGTDINLSSDSPDGQMMMIQIQAVLDLQDLVRQVFNSMDPDLAVGVVLDQRVSINGIQRQAGTRTVTPITITTNRALTLNGADQTVYPVYTVADNAGNQWQLINSYVVSGAGTYVLSFQSAVVGQVQSIPNTITVPVSIVLGVTAINNPTSYTSLGINEETDTELRIRRQKSVSLASQGYLAGLLAALENISGMASAYVYENTTGSTDGDGIPGHSIWVIVAGTPASADIANAIYTKRNAGCGMKGTQTYNISQADGSTFTIRWDVVSTENLFIQFTATSLDGVNPPNIAGIRNGLPSSFAPGVFEKVNANVLADKVRAIDPNTLVTSAGFSSTAGGTYTAAKVPSAKNKQFVVSAPNIIVLPVLPSPSAPTIVHGVAQDFTALGGYGAYTWTFVTNNSGGTLTTGGHYVAGGTHPVTDTIKVTDSLGNFTNVSVAVI